MQSYRRFVTVFSPNSTRADKYIKIRPQLIDLAHDARADYTEIRLEDTPYYNARHLIGDELKDGDLLIACGGDGTTQVAFDALYRSEKDVTFATIPLGNGNDTARAFYGGKRSPNVILQSDKTDFTPLNIYINGREQFALCSYITFGATTILVDYLNDTSSRKRRKHLKALSPAMSVPLARLSDISSAINQMDFPDFTRDGTAMSDDSIGFFLISAAHDVLRLPKNYLHASTNFYFHHANTGDKNLAQKIIMAGLWTLKFPGETSNLEELTFARPSAITANVAGDNISLDGVRQIVAMRSQRPVKVLMLR